MATCKDCVHVEVCGTFSILSESFEIASPERIASDCEHFKDRSRFVELPCKLGDTVYYFNSAGKIFSQKVSGFIVNFVGFLVHLMGDRFFSTREEAEQALKLKERES